MRDQVVARPVGQAGQGRGQAPAPGRVDLGVDDPGYGASTCSHGHRPTPRGDREGGGGAQH